MKSIVRSLAVEMALQQRAMGRRIAQLRERSRMTQEVAADKAGVTLRAYQKWEAGGGIQYANLQKLADLFKVPVERITGEEATPDPFKTGSQLDQIQLELEAARSERADLRDQIAEQNKLLARQSKILAKIEDLVGVLKDAEIISEPREAASAPTDEKIPPPPDLPAPPAVAPIRRRAARAPRRSA